MINPIHVNEAKHRYMKEESARNAQEMEEKTDSIVSKINSAIDLNPFAEEWIVEFEELQPGECVDAAVRRFKDAGDFQMEVVERHGPSNCAIVVSELVKVNCA